MKSRPCIFVSEYGKMLPLVLVEEVYCELHQFKLVERMKGNQVREDCCISVEKEERKNASNFRENQVLE